MQPCSPVVLASHSLAHVDVKCNLILLGEILIRLGQLEALEGLLGRAGCSEVNFGA